MLKKKKTLVNHKSKDKIINQKQSLGKMEIWELRSDDAEFLTAPGPRQCTVDLFLGWNAACFLSKWHSPEE